MNARELERMMVQTFGADFRDKSVAGWPLRDCFAECGLEDPAHELISGRAVGLWQIMPVPFREHVKDCTPEHNARRALRALVHNPLGIIKNRGLPGG